MIINPEKMVFENTTDIVDYVSRGLPPTRKNFEKVMLKVRCPDSEEHESNEVHIHERLFINCDNDTMTEALNRVYENRIRNRNITIAVVGIVAMGLIFGKMSNGKHKKHKDEEDVNVDNFFDSDLLEL
jgi:hypothetical protein